MPFRLALDLEGRTVRRPLPEGTTVLGSGPPETGVGLRVQHPSVSRRHARLTVAGRGVEVADLGSSNGTRLDGRRLAAAAPVETGGRLTFGTVEARLEEAPEGDDQPAVELAAAPETAAPGAAAAPASTAALAPARGFLHGELPALLRGIAGGGGRLEHAQALGAALFRSLPCLEVAIHELAEGRTAILFEGRRPAAGPAAEPVVVEAERRGLRVRVAFLQRGVAGACRGVVETAADLLAAAAGPPGAGPAPRPAAPRREPPPLPAPPTLDLRTAAIYAQAARVAAGRIGVLIRGESGTGKEVLARYLHRASGLSGPFVALNCAALPGDLLEAELFGIERGVATGVEAREGKFEAADGGTLFLDEIGDMAPPTQAKILRVLQEREVYRLGGRAPHPARGRVIAATHRDVEAMLACGDFRADLYHRIAGWEVTLPPLRERRADIANLAAHFLVLEGEALGIRPAGISRAALEALEACPWPGNVRQLRTEIARAALFLADGELLDTALLDPRLLGAGGRSRTRGLKATLEGVERDEIARALRAANGSAAAAAHALRVPVSTLYRRIKKLGVPDPRDR
jgi:hypothetical protein